MRKDSLVRYFISVTFLLVLSVIFLWPLTANAGPTQKVLLINSYHVGYKWSDDLTAAFVDELNTAQDVDLRVEYLDTKRYYSNSYFTFQSDIIAEKYKGETFDVIVCSDNNALSFLLENRQKLFPGTPVVFCGINYFKQEILQGQSNITGVNETVDIKKNVDLMLSVHPKTKRIITIVDDSVTAQVLEKELLGVRDSYPKIEWFTPRSKSLEELQTFLKNLDADDLVLLGLFLRDKQGTYYEFDEIASGVSGSSARPVYALWDFYLREGVIGGYMASGTYQGKVAAGLVSEILGGRSVNDIPVVMESPNRYLADYAAMSKFGLKTEQFPHGTVVYNEPPDFYEEHKVAIWLFFVLFTLLCFLTLFLSITVVRKRIAEKSLLVLKNDLEQRVVARTEELSSANAEITEREQRIQNLLTNLSSMIYRYKNDGGWKLISVNKAAEKLTGYSEAELLENAEVNYNDLIVESDRQMVESKIKDAISNGVAFELEYRIQTKEEQVKWVWEQGMAIYDEDDLPLFLDGKIMDISQRKRIEKSERKYRGIIDNLQDLYIRTDLKGKILMVSPSIHKVLGYPEEYQFLGRNILKTLYVTPEERSKLIQKLRQEETVTNYELEFKTFADGSITVSASLSLLLNEEEEVVGVEGVFKNITPLKRAHEKLVQLNETLKSSEERLELALAGAHDGVWDWNLLENSVSFDARSYTMAGYEPDEFPSTFEEWERRVHPEDRGRLQEAIGQCLDGRGEGKLKVEFRFIRKDTSYMWIRGKGQVVQWERDGRPSRFIGTQSDITDIREAQKELEDSREAFRLLYQQTPVMLHNIDTEGAITEVNDQWLRTLGYKREEVLGRASLDFLTPESRKRAVELIPVLNEKQFLNDIEYQFVTKSGEIVDTLLTAHMVKNVDGEWLGTRAAIVDITESKRVQEEKDNLVKKLHHTQKMEAIETLSGGIAHDFNNMLGAMAGGIELLEDYLPDDNKARDLHKTLLDSILRAAGLTQKLKNFSRQSSGVSKPINLHNLVKETVNLLENSIDPRVTIEMELGVENCNILADSPLLQNALLNLGLNASQAMPDGGLLQFTTREFFVDEAYCSTSSFKLEPGKFVEIEIKDSGCGIPGDDLSRIFEPFFTTKEKSEGTGLGLASVYSTVQQHNGAIGVESEVGKGTTFHLLLPLTDLPVELHKATEVKKGSGRILVVDDDILMRAISKSVLEKLGYEILEAENGKVAIELFLKERDTIDLILLDMIMPVMNGRDCFERIRAIDHKAVIVLCSGFSEEEYLQEMQVSGLNGYVQKPFVTSELSQVIHNALSERTETF